MKFKKIKTNKKIKNKTNKYLFLLITVMLLSLSVGYSAINSDVTISGEANFRVLEELRITDISLYETTYNGEESYSPKFTKDSLTIGVGLKEVESTVTYKMELINYGTVIAWYTDEDENNLYELYLGGNGKVYAPVNSEGLFGGFSNIISIFFGNYFDTSKVTSMKFMFQFNNKLTNLDICNFDFSLVAETADMFYNVPVGCEIIVKSDTERDWLLNVKSTFTNIKTVAELESI